MKQPVPRFALFIFFFASGFCGLLYQVVWLRLAYAHFGVITPVLSVVVSVFMLGLWLGTWAGGRWAEALSRASGISALGLYAGVEALVGLGAFAVPALFNAAEHALLAAGESDSAGYLARSAGAIAVILLPWCTAMGATYPLMLAHLRQDGVKDENGFSFLYLANVLGAIVGVALTALVLVEWLGLRATLRVAAGLNFAVALAAWGLALRRGGLREFPDRAARKAGPALQARRAEPPLSARDLSVLFGTGFVAMGMEVVWTRAFTPVVGTQVYSFAGILFGYLAATSVGSWLYRRQLAAGNIQKDGRLIGLSFVAALLPLLAADPRLGLGVAGVLLSILPFCMLLGYLTPLLVDRLSRGAPDRAGRAYAVNILGSCLGPLVASYLLLPFLGVKGALVALTAPLLLLLPLTPRHLGPALAGVLALVGAGLWVWTYENPGVYRQQRFALRRDATATTVAYGRGFDMQLLVNGVGITKITPITKMMAHLPAAAHAERPQRGLVICLGMGTTFRSLSSWGMETTVVELVPGVRDLFRFFFINADEVRTRPGNRMVVDDGRRFLMRSSESFDVITLDPPPPISAAASSLLYSEDFYDLARRRMRPGAVLQQWVPLAPRETLLAVAYALRSRFRHVRMYRSIEGWGFHFLASDSPLADLDAAALAKRLPDSARRDLLEWTPERQAAELFQAVLAQRVDLDKLLEGWSRGITDDRPYNEYYLLRTLFPSLRDRLN